jgi:hypothetical protein
MRREVTIHIAPDGTRTVIEDNPTTVIVDALVIDDRGRRRRTARLTVRSVEQLVSGLDRLEAELAAPQQRLSRRQQA